MHIDQLHKVYFLGIGGIGMSSIARYFAAQGIQVLGYDRTPTVLTRTLESEGIEVRYEENVATLPTDLDLVVWTPAIPAQHTELLHFRAIGMPLHKRAEVLGWISTARKCIGLAGTHGKTTTTTMTTHLLRSGGVDATGFLGGIAVNYGTNYVAGNSDWVVVEADEYDRSFLQLRPTQAVITGTDADHLDIYGSHESIMETGFRAFVQQVADPSKVLIHADVIDGFAPAGYQSYGTDKGMWRSTNVRIERGVFVFDFECPMGQLQGLTLAVPGFHNVENATAAIGMALMAGVPLSAISKGIATFKGVKRRFEYIYRDHQFAYIDDYAHHPTELAATIRSARALFPGESVVGVFQPHLFSRTKDFMSEFAEALDGLDELWLLDIYPARELPMEGITSDALAAQMKMAKVHRGSKAEALEWLTTQKPQVLITMGAGDIDTMIEGIKKIYTP